MGSLEHSNKDTLNLFKDLDIGKYEGHLNPPNYTSPLVYSAHVHAQDRRQTSDVPAIREGDHASKDVEMAFLSSKRFGRRDDLNNIREVDRAIDEIDGRLRELQDLQQYSLQHLDFSQYAKAIEDMTSTITGLYRNLPEKIKDITNVQHIGRLDRRLKQTAQKYYSLDSGFREKRKEEIERQYRIVRPEATEAEVREAVEDTSSRQLFLQTLLKSDRRGESRAALYALQHRHEGIQTIEQQMIELAQLFQDMQSFVVQQESAVTTIETKQERTAENVDKGVKQVGFAVKKARNKRKWKWWCLVICVLIVITIVVVILIYKFVVQGNGSSSTP